MTLLYADLSGIPVAKASLTVPASGLWHVDVTLDRAVDIAGPQVFTLSGSTWACTVVRAIDFSGIRMVRLVAGTGGWRTPVTYRQYASPTGVTLAMVMTDLATLVQEIPPVLSPLLPPTVGAAYVRRAGLASLTLQDLLGDVWWADMSGVIQTSVRDPSPITSAFVATDVEGASGTYTIATEFPGDWLPGRTWIGPTSSGTVNRVRHVLESGSLRTEVMVS